MFMAVGRRGKASGGTKDRGRGNLRLSADGAPVFILCSRVDAQPSTPPLSEPLPVMHPCLQNEDILGIIFEFFSNSSVKQLHEPLISDSATLVSLVRTCKTFHPSASRVLWRAIPGLHVLAEFFPEGLIASGDSGSLVR